MRDFSHLKHMGPRRQTVQIRNSVHPKFSLVVHQETFRSFGGEAPFRSDFLPMGICEAEEPAGSCGPDCPLPIQREFINARRWESFSLTISLAASVLEESGSV